MNRNSIVLFRVCVALCIGLLLAGSSQSVAEDDGQAVKYQRIGLREYQNFLIGWDASSQPQRFALIRSAPEYDQLFQPAAVNGARGPFAPSPKSYEKEQILLVGREMPAPTNMESVFEIESLQEKGGMLLLKYRYKAPKPASYEVRNYLAIRVPAKAYDRVIFVENGKEVGELQVGKGQWVKPGPKNE